MANVISLNNDIKKLYGYENQEVIGQNINKIMPQYYEELHDQYFSNYFESEEITREYITRERTVYPVSKKGYVVPSSLMIKLLPSLENTDIKMVGFLTHIRASKESTIDDQNILLFEKEKGNLHGLTLNASKQYGIPLSLVEGKSSKNHNFKIGEIFEGINQPKNFRQAEKSGLICTLNTLCIRENYMLDQEDVNLVIYSIGQ